MQTSVLKPGLMVSLHTSVRGGVTYSRREIEIERRRADGSAMARWETTREIPDPDEYARAVAVRGRARTIVTAVCATSAFGLLCPSDRESDLEEAIREARAVAAAHNASAALTRVAVDVLVGRIAQDDADAMRAIGRELRELLDAMQRGIAAVDPSAIREAANRAKSLGAMLTDETRAVVDAAITEARAAARSIVRRVEKAGEDAALVVQDIRQRDLAAARFKFLDIVGEDEIGAPGEPEADALSSLSTEELMGEVVSDLTRNVDAVREFLGSAAPAAVVDAQPEVAAAVDAAVSSLARAAVVERRSLMPRLDLDWGN